MTHYSQTSQGYFTHKLTGLTLWLRNALKLIFITDKSTIFLTLIIQDTFNNVMDNRQENADDYVLNDKSTTCIIHQLETKLHKL